MKTALAILSCSIVLAACAGMAQQGPGASAALKPTRGNNATGIVTFTQKDGKILVSANIRGLTPGQHGFHIHEKGDCSAPDGMSAGGHFNPRKKSHGGPSGAERHGGDLGNLTADSYGNAKPEIEVDGISMGSGPDSIMGKAVIVHANPDDFTTQPTGNSGGRVACGVIVMTQTSGGSGSGMGGGYRY